MSVTTNFCRHLQTFSKIDELYAFRFDVEVHSILSKLNAIYRTFLGKGNWYVISLNEHNH